MDPLEEMWNRQEPKDEPPLVFLNAIAKLIEKEVHRLLAEYERQRLESAPSVPAAAPTAIPTPRPTPNFDDPTIQVDLQDPVVQFIAAVVDQVEGEPWYGRYYMFSSWINPAAHSTNLCGPNKGAVTRIHRQYNWHYKTLFEVARRVYEQAIAHGGPPPVQRPVPPLIQLARQTERVDRGFLRRNLDQEHHLN